MPTVEINLLPPQFKPLPPYSARNILIILSLACLASLLLLVSWRVLNIKAEYRERLGEHIQKLETYKNQREEIIELQKIALEMKIYLEFLDDIMKQRITWVDKFTDMYYRLPSGVWLNEVIIVRKKPEASAKSVPSQATSQTMETILLRISGDAYSMDQIGELLANLDESPLFKNTRFFQALKMQGEGSMPDYISFKIETELETTERIDYEKETKTGKKSESEEESGKDISK